VDVEVSKLKFNREKDLLLGEGKDFVAAQGWEIIEFEYPILAVILTHPKNKRRLGFRFLCDDWDDQPPSLSLFDPASPKVELPWAKWPQKGWNVGDRHAHYPKPFLCLPGIREYHSHPNHLGDHWVNYRANDRDSYKLRYIVDRVHQKFSQSND
jgi:hypothetical protein